jgi:hypothetical protein
LSAHGVAVMDVRPAAFGAELVTQYLSWKSSGAL